MTGKADAVVVVNAVGPFTDSDQPAAVLPEQIMGAVGIGVQKLILKQVES